MHYLQLDIHSTNKDISFNSICYDTCKFIPLIQLLFFYFENGVMDGHTTMECKRTVNFKSKVLVFIVVILQNKPSSSALKNSNHYLA